MGPTLRILNLEDDLLDADLALATLRKDGLAAEMKRVDTLSGFSEELRRGGHALILADFSIPGMDAVEALLLVREVRPEIPFLFLSGAIGEDAAIELLKLGASDYVLKQRIERLAPAVRRALLESEETARRKQAEQALRESERRLRTLGDQIPGGAIYQHVQRPDGRMEYAYMSAGIEAIVGLPANRVMADVDAFRRLIVEEDLARVAAAERQSARKMAPLDCEFRQRTVTGEIKWIHCRSTPRPLEDGSLLWDGLVADITERKRREEQIVKLTRLYAVLSQVNEAIVRTRDVEPLYAEVCRILAEKGGFPLAWIGEAHGKQVVPAASRGPAAGYLKEIAVETEGALGRGPTGTCIRENRSVVTDDFAVSPATAPWREAAGRYGFRASAAFPLRRRGAAIGALTLYACEPNTFDAQQVALLESLSADISYAIDALDQEQLRRQAEEALRKAHRELERRVAERTAELAETVEELHDQIQERIAAEQALQHEHRSLVRLLQARDRERQAISLGIHDQLAQPLTSATMHLQAADGLRNEDPEAAAEARSAGINMLRASINEARRLIDGVRPPILEDEGVEAAIAHLACEFRGPDAPQVELYIDAKFDRLAPSLESAIFRIAQEGIDNARKHSRSDRVRVDLLQHGDRLHIEIRDWGVGFDPQAIKEESFGLEEIRERARLLGGTTSIESAPGQGTRIFADLPLLPGAPTGPRC